MGNNPVKLRDQCLVAIKNKNVVELKRIRQKGCPWDEYIYNKILEVGDLDCLKFAIAAGCYFTNETAWLLINYGHIDCLKWTIENGCPLNERASARAALMKDLKLLKYLREEKKCPWNKTTCEGAAIVGSLECLDYAHRNGCPWDKKTCEMAAKFGNIECLDYAHRNGCPWDEEAFAEAAHMGKLESLQYLHDNHCPCNERACQFASMAGKLDCLTFLHEHNYPWDRFTVVLAKTTECMNYAIENGCPLEEENKPRQFLNNITDVPIENVDNNTYVQMCSLCWANQAIIGFSPCGHMICCASCARELVNKTKPNTKPKCPYCSGEIERMTRMYI